MDKNQALEICKNHYPVWERFKKDSTTRDNSPNMFNELNLVHRFVFGYFADMGCSDCIREMFKMVFNWYERELVKAKESEPLKMVHITMPETPKEVTDLSNKTYKELLGIAKDRDIKLEHNVSKKKLIELLK